jgi:hypothetical protein
MADIFISYTSSDRELGVLDRVRTGSSRSRAAHSLREANLGRAHVERCGRRSPLEHPSAKAGDLTRE